MSSAAKSALSVSDYRVTLRELNDFVYITREWRAVDVVCSEELLRLGGIVDLLHEEIRDGVVRQACDS